jgi:hypothetical protein
MISWWMLVDPYLLYSSLQSGHSGGGGGDSSSSIGVVGKTK